MGTVLRIIPVLLLLSGSGLFAQTAGPPSADTTSIDTTVLLPAPVTNLQAFDSDNDHGHAVTLTWTKSADDVDGQASVLNYDIFRWFPFQLDVVDSLRGLLANTRAGARSLRSDIPRAKHALSQLLDNPDKLGTIRFGVATPADDTGFELTAEYAIQALRDTIAAMERQLPELRARVRPLQGEFGEALDQLPAAHEGYPENGEWRSVGKVASGITEFENAGSKHQTASDFFPDYVSLYYRVEAVTADTSVRSEPVIAGPVESKGQWFHMGKAAVFAFVIVFWILTVYFVRKARRKADLYVRPLAGIEAVDDAIGRATEMGRPILYVLGLGSAEMIATIASFTILGRVAKRVAEYQTQIIVPCYDAIVMAVAQEVVQAAYLDAGRADDYDENSVHYVTSLQFAYVAAVNGIMLRELPATNMYMGKFFAESLLLAETGTLAGSIQIAGTDEIAQIPFFIVACDYTLIGEELYAASAYLGREPILLGSLKAQDWAKAAIIIIAIVGMLATAFGWPAFAEAFAVSD